MAVPRDEILLRLNRNIDSLLDAGGRLIRSMFVSEIYSPFRSSGKSGEASPFLKSLYPEIRVAAMLERSLNTALGWGWDKIVCAIAKSTHGNSDVNHMVVGELPPAAIQKIDSICMAYTSGVGHTSPSTTGEFAQVTPLLAGGAKMEPLREKSDAFYVDGNGIEHYVEIKTPKPNYDQLRAAKRRILNIRALRHPVAVHAFVGMAYNPNGLLCNYGWPTTPFFLDPAVDIKVGRTFWNYMGDSPDTYEELIDCFHTVAVARRTELIALLEMEER